MANEQALVTKAMIDAGKEIAANLLCAYACKKLEGLGSDETWDEWKLKNIQNIDLCIAYAEDCIDSVTAIYLAMKRADK